MIPSGLHELIVEMADKYLRELTDAQIIALCPNDYGSTVTDDHRTLVWDLFYEDVASMEPMEIYDMHRRFIAGREHMGQALERYLNTADALNASKIATDWTFLFKRPGGPDNSSGGAH